MMEEGEGVGGEWWEKLEGQEERWGKGESGGEGISCKAFWSSQQSDQLDIQPG